MPTTFPNIVVLTYEPPPITVVVDDNRTVVAVADPEMAIVIVPGLPGPAGADGGPGGSGDADIAEINATENIAALRFVTAGGKTANSANTAHFNHVVGFTMDAVTNGFIATCIIEGEVTDASWTWTANQKLFLNGTTLSTTPASAGFSQLVGITRDSDTIFLRLDVPILL